MIEFVAKVFGIKNCIKFIEQTITLNHIEKFQNLLTRAGVSAKRKASRKKLPVPISENGEVKLVYPNKKIKVLHRAKQF